MVREEDVLDRKRWRRKKVLPTCSRSSAGHHRNSKRLDLHCFHTSRYQGDLELDMFSALSDVRIGHQVALYARKNCIFSWISTFSVGTTSCNVWIRDIFEK